jgi:hypothetical protein
VAADLCEKPGFFSAAHNHAARVVPRHSIVSELLAATARTGVTP